jgi:hypothetical protein
MNKYTSFMNIDRVRSLSDVISFDSEMKMPETGWLLSVANRYGRPVFCTNWNPPDIESAGETMELFSRNRVYWFVGSLSIQPDVLREFRFIQIATPFQ